MHLFNGPILSSRILTAISVISILLASAALLERNTLLSFLLLLLFFLQAHLGHPLQPALFSKVNQLPPVHDTDKRQKHHVNFCARTSQHTLSVRLQQ